MVGWLRIGKYGWVVEWLGGLSGWVVEGLLKGWVVE
jgi:hypothetical protein